MDPTTNPYAPGAGSTPPFLAGRDAEFQGFELLMRRLEAGRSAKSLLITGLRGVGKTVLLNSFVDRAERRSWIAQTAELQTETRLPALMTRLARKSLLQMRAVDRLKKQAMRALGVLKAFAISVGDVKVNIDVDALEGTADSGSLEDDLGELLMEIGRAAKSGRIGVVFLLDEMQLLDRADLEALIAAFHRVAQRSLPVSLVGAGLPLLPKLAGEAKSYAERLFDFRKIGSLDEAAARAALEKPAEQEKVAYERAAVDRILSYSERFPYFLQEYGRHVWTVAPGSPIRAGDVDRAHPRVLTELDEGFYEVRLERTPTNERRYMLGMAAFGDGPAPSGDVARLLGYPGPGAASPLREGLLKKGLIYSPRYGVVDFTVPRFAEFLRRANTAEVAELAKAVKRMRKVQRRAAMRANGPRTMTQVLIRRSP